MNTPNKLTVLRMILVPIMLVASLINIPGEILNIPISWWIMDLLFVIGAITDKIDGTLARKRNQVTNFGKFLDPIADKIIVISALIILVGQLKIPTWIPVIVIIREFAVSGYRLIAVESNGEVIAANKWGKIKTVTQMLAITIAFLDKNPFGTIFMGDLDTIPFIINLVSLFCTSKIYFEDEPDSSYIIRGRDNRISLAL